MIGHVNVAGLALVGLVVIGFLGLVWYTSDRRRR